VTVLNAEATFNEFTLLLPKGGAQVVESLLTLGMAAGVPLGGYYAGMDNAIVVTVTEKRTKNEIDRLVTLLEEALCN
jgi:glycine dehydrogenase subunit 1